MIMESERISKARGLTSKKYLTKKETRDFFQVSYTTIDSWAQKGYLEKYKVGYRVYFLKEQVENTPTKVLAQ